MQKIRRSDCVATRVARMNSRLPCEDRHIPRGKCLFQGGTRCPQLVAKNGSASSEAFHARSRTFLTLTLKRADVLHPRFEGETLEAFTRVELSNGESAPLLCREGFYLAGHSIALAIGFHGVDLVVIGGLRL